MDVGTNKLMGGYLRRLREAAGLTQTQLAHKRGVPQSAVSKLESGERSLLFYEVFGYSEALGIDADDFFAGAKDALLRRGKGMGS